METYDFSGWATKNDLQCSDGRIIRKDAFKHCDGMTVPLVWNHNHDDPYRVVGHARLENRDEGVYTYGKFNETDLGKTAKIYVQHGDITQLSIYANQLRQQGPNVLHGAIREVSLVLAGANPGACIETVLQHGEEVEDEGVIYTGEDISLEHSESEPEVEVTEADAEVTETEEPEKSEKTKESEELEHSDEEKEDTKVAEKEKAVSAENEKDPTIQDVIDKFEKFSDEDKDVVYAMIGMALEEQENDDDNDETDEGGNEMKHNVFDKEETMQGGVLTHSDQQAILAMAKTTSVGSFQAAFQQYAEENELKHAAASVGGFQQTGAEGELTVDALFPEYKDVKPGAPELITNDQGWVSVVMSKVHKSPISRIRTGQVDIRNIDALRAKGYKKGDEKKYTGNFKLVRRTTDPQTIYVKNALHRDDITDIVDFDYVQYLYNIDRMMLNEEMATAIMFGDGRDDGDEAKISPEHIRPIWTDDDLYTLHVDLDVAAMKTELQGSEAGAYFGDNFVRAEALINKVLYARENFKGSGTPDAFIDPHELNVMLLARDRNGHRMYASKSELAAALNVGNIYTVEQMKGKTRKGADGKDKKLLCIIANLSDYSLGATKGGEVTHFTQFDIDFNQQKSLLETRCSGALTKVYSAIAIEENTEVAAG